MVARTISVGELRYFGDRVHSWLVGVQCRVDVWWKRWGQGRVGRVCG